MNYSINLKDISRKQFQDEMDQNDFLEHRQSLDTKNLSWLNPHVEFIREEILSQSLFYCSSFRKLALEFLQYFYPVNKNIWKNTTSDIRDWYCLETQKGECNTIPVNDKFYLYVCKKYLFIDSEPVVHFLDLYEEYIYQLEQITKNIEYCNSMLQNIHGKSQKEDIDIYDSKLYSNFKELYEDLRMSTINCLTNRTKINSKIKMLSLNHPLFMKLAASVILPDMYEIALHDANYDVRNFSRINNKLRVLSIDSNLRKFLFDLERRAEKDESDSKKLTNLLYELLTKDKLIEKLRKILDRTPLLKHRSSIIKHSLSCFEKQDYLIFCNLIAIQIEGIFYDYLVALGINPGNEKLTLIPKVEKLENADTLEEWAYFKFRALPV